VCNVKFGCKGTKNNSYEQIISAKKGTSHVKKEQAEGKWEQAIIKRNKSCRKGTSYRKREQAERTTTKLTRL